MQHPATLDIFLLHPRGQFPLQTQSSVVQTLGLGMIKVDKIRVGVVVVGGVLTGVGTWRGCAMWWVERDRKEAREGGGPAERMDRAGGLGDGVGFVAFNDGKRMGVRGRFLGRQGGAREAMRSRFQAGPSRQSGQVRSPSHRQVTQVTRNQLAQGHGRAGSTGTKKPGKLEGSSHVSHRLPGCLLAVCSVALVENATSELPSAAGGMCVSQNA
ncbi:hypothetical protein VTI74DRAFT_7473 [Chaetomium olivicolor]